MAKITTIALNAGEQGPPGPPSATAGSVALTDGQFPINRGGTLVAETFTNDVAAAVPGLGTTLAGILHHRAHHAIIVAASDSPAWAKTMADYVGTGTADDVKWQAAIDEAQTYASNARGIISAVPEVLILPGHYAFSSPVTWRTASLRGLLPYVGVVVSWDGSAGATVVTKSGTDPGGTAFGHLSGILFQEGTAIPGAYLDLTAAPVDKHLKLDSVAFSGGQRQVKLGAWTNLQWRDLRFDKWRTWALEATIPAGANLGSFVIDHLTMDNGGVSPGTALGGFRIDNTTANASNLGTFHLADFRFELNSTYGAGAPGGLVTISMPSSSPNVWIVGVHLEDLVYQDVIGTTDSLVYADTTSPNGAVSLMLDNVRQQGLANLIGGSQPSWASLPALQNNYGLLSVNAGNNIPSLISDRLDLYVGQGATAMQVYRTGSGTPVATMTDTGQLRVASLGVGNAASATTPASVVRKIEVFDASGTSLGFIPVYSSIS